MATKIYAIFSFLARYRRTVSLLANAVVIAAAYSLSFLLRFDLTIPGHFRTVFLSTLAAIVVIQYAAFYAFNFTRGWWRYVGIADFVNCLKAAIVGALGLVSYVMLFHRRGMFPRSVFLINAVVVVGLSIGVRLVVRLLRQRNGPRSTGDNKRLLIVGAGDTGEALLRETRQSRRLNYEVVAFLDDDASKRGAYVNGVPVLHPVSSILGVVQQLDIDEIVVATPAASGAEMRVITEYCSHAGVPFKVMPATWEFLGGQVSLRAAREVNINDLLRRPPVELDLEGIGRFVRNKRVLVTGAAGSIGSEICRQIHSYRPTSIICLDHDENALFDLQRSMAQLDHAHTIHFRLADVTNRAHIESIFADTKPQVVYHAAAHKHVPLIEHNPIEGVRNNVFGTELVARTAAENQAEAFVLISTDKAVNPSSVMGVTKRIAELLVQTLAPCTRFTTVRFGNVLGSQGSVVPILKEQIAAGGPVTVTHPDMRRFFMTIPEAVQLVIQASAMGTGNAVFMLDMGEPVKIMDLARDLIRLSGLRPDEDIEIQITGVRPGEKLNEELHLAAEVALPTSHPKILAVEQTSFDRQALASCLTELRRRCDDLDERGLTELLVRLVPEYKKPAAVANVVPIVVAQVAATTTA